MMAISKWSKLAVAGVLSASAAIMSGCSTAPKIHSIYEQGIDFTQYKTFAFLDSHEPKGEEYVSLNDKYLRDAITQELLARGLTESDNSDLLVGFHVSSKEKISSTTYPSASMGYYGYRGRYGYSYGMGYGTETRVNQYTEGTLNIDVVNRKKKQLIWEGVAVGRLKDKPSEDWKAEIFTTVDSVFKEYPVPEQSAQ